MEGTQCGPIGSRNKLLNEKIHYLYLSAKIRMIGINRKHDTRRSCRLVFMGKGSDCLHEIGKLVVRDNLVDLRVDGILVGCNWRACNYVTKSNEVRSFHTGLFRPQFKFLNHKRIKIYTTWLHFDTQTHLADLTYCSWNFY